MDFNLKVDFNDKGEIKCKEEEEESRNVNNLYKIK